MFAQSSPLGALITEDLRNREPLQRLAKIPMIRRDDAGECGRHFRPQSNSAFPFVDEFVELTHDFVARFLFVEIEFLEQRAIVFDEAVAARDLAPFGEDIIPLRAGDGEKIAKSGKRLHSGGEDNYSKLRKNAAASHTATEPSVRLNKTRRGQVKTNHDAEHPFNKAKD